MSTGYPMESARALACSAVSTAPSEPGTTGTPALYVAGALLCGFCYGGVPVVASAFARQRYGARNYPLNLSLANFAIVFGSLLNVVVQAAVGGADHRVAVFAVMGALSLVAALDVLPFSRKWDRDLKMLEARRRQVEESGAAAEGAGSFPPSSVSCLS